MVIFEAHFDGEHICPDQPVSLPINVPLQVVVNEKDNSSSSVQPDVTSSPAASNEASGQAANGEPTGKKSWLAQLEQEHGLIDGPADWSAELDHYLYGMPKRGTDPGA